MASLVLALSVGVAGGASAGEVVFRLLEDQLAGGSPKVVNGEPPPKPQEWRSILVANIDPAGDKRCTAALVGVRAVLTAAHCLDLGETFVLEPVLAIGADTIGLKCRLHHFYPTTGPYVKGSPRSTADYALCRLAAAPDAIPRLVGVPFEVVDLAAPAEGEALILNGYGCTELKPVPPNGVAAGKDQKQFRIAEDAADRVVKRGGHLLIESLSPSGQQPALCPGDSGGPALAPGGQGAGRRVRGVASSVVSESPQPPAWAFVSRIAPTGANEFQKFAEAWLVDHPDAWICGVSPGHEGGTPRCRD